MADHEAVRTQRLWLKTVAGAVAGVSTFAAISAAVRSLCGGSCELSDLLSPFWAVAVSVLFGILFIHIPGLFWFSMLGEVVLCGIFFGPALLIWGMTACLELDPQLHLGKIAFLGLLLLPLMGLPWKHLFRKRWIYVALGGLSGFLLGRTLLRVPWRVFDVAGSIDMSQAHHLYHSDLYLSFLGGALGAILFISTHQPKEA